MGDLRKKNQERERGELPQHKKIKKFAIIFDRLRNNNKQQQHEEIGREIERHAKESSQNGDGIWRGKEKREYVKEMRIQHKNKQMRSGPSFLAISLSSSCSFMSMLIQLLRVYL